MRTKTSPRVSSQSRTKYARWEVEEEDWVGEDADLAAEVGSG
jgi:hypothetical protein